MRAPAWRPGNTLLPSAPGVVPLTALKASRCDPNLEAFYERLRAAGKPDKIALLAAMRKLLVHLNAMLKHHRTWRAPPLTR